MSENLEIVSKICSMAGKPVINKVGFVKGGGGVRKFKTKIIFANNACSE
jgi:hypothetical protein